MRSSRPRFSRYRPVDSSCSTRAKWPWQFYPRRVDQRLDEPAEFQMLVAHHAVKRATAYIVGKILNHVLLKILSFIDEIIANAKVGANGAGVHDGLWTAALVFRAGHAILRPQLESNTDDLVACSSNNAAVAEESPATHTTQDARFLGGGVPSVDCSAFSALEALSTRSTRRPLRDPARWRNRDTRCSP